jgi:hypothetical protein
VGCCPSETPKAVAKHCCLCDSVGITVIGGLKRSVDYSCSYHSIAVKSLLFRLKNFSDNYAANAAVDGDWSSIASVVGYPS